VPLDTAWALEQLNEFIRLTELYKRPDPPGVTSLTARMSNRGRPDEIAAPAQVVEQILDRVLRDWRCGVPAERNRSVNRWCQHIEAAHRAKAQLRRDAELREKLGDDAPQLDGNQLHPWVWESARSLW